MNNLSPCGGDWPAWLWLLYVGTEVLMFAGYAITAYLFWDWLRPRHVTVLKKIFIVLGFVFLLCGMTHGARVLGVTLNWTVLMVLVNAVSAVFIVGLLLLIIPMLPKIMKCPKAREVGKMNTELRQGVSDLLERNAELATVDNLKAVANIKCAISAIRDLARVE